MSIITNTIKEDSLLFKKSKTYQYLRKFKIFRELKKGYKKIISSFSHSYPFHNDLLLQKALILTIREIKPTSLVETGTYLGASTSFMAKNFPNILVYTCEINDKNYRKSIKNLRKYKNVKIIKGNSPEFLQKMINKKLLGERPLFFLDAHWEKYWPLEEEIKIITTNCKSAVILIDDFKISDSPQFGFDKYDSKDCSLELIRHTLNKKNKYNLLFPNYNKKDFPKKKVPKNLTGYPIIFMNLLKEFRELSSNPLVKRYFMNRSDLFKNKS